MESQGSAGPGSPSEAPGAGAPRPLHARSFKLRFAPQRELGRSYVSLVKPRALPATVTGKFYRREEQGAEGAAAALARIEAMFARGPRDLYDAPLTTSHEYGWYSERAAASDPRLQQHSRDSAWLKARLRVLAADDKLKQR